MKRRAGMRVFDRVVGRGEKATFQTGVASYPDGGAIGVWVRAVNGSKEGPRVALLGVQHGDEYSGMEIINRIIDSLSPAELSGSVVAVPVSNPLAFNAAGRITPPAVGYENLNMNRVWPGNPGGLLTERVAAQLWEHVVEGSDAVLDLHEGGKAFMARYIHARGTEETDKIVGTQNRRLYTLFGQGVPVLGGVRTRSHMMGSLSIQTGLRGIPCIGPELGGGGRLWEELVQVGVAGVRNILIGLGFLQGEPVGQGLRQHVAPESTWPKTSGGGVMYNTCELGSIVEKGERLGILRDPAGRVLEELYAPYRSVIFDTRFQPTVYPGDWTFHCGKIG
ncbi:succinylglutamate desuccinylase/aspartoacylase family protein [Candidatus Bathyarchaeota archaeon]|nr:succinylglutamate desuccinylase/aspartoacylase family protein [Candidatus Bathyarchaeota archaeon]